MNVLLFLIITNLALDAADSSARPDTLAALRSSISVDKSSGSYRLAVTYLDGYKLNDRAPEARRLTLVLDDGQRFDATKFSRSPSGATLTFEHGANQPPTGTFTALLCKPSRCTRVSLALDWSELSEGKPSR